MSKAAWVLIGAVNLSALALGLSVMPAARPHAHADVLRIVAVIAIGVVLRGFVTREAAKASTRGARDATGAIQLAIAFVVPWHEATMSLVAIEALHRLHSMRTARWSAIAWVRSAFNASVAVIAAAVTLLVLHLELPNGVSFARGSLGVAVLATLAAVVANRVVNDALVALVLRLTAGTTARETGLFGLTTLVNEIVMYAYGLPLAYVLERSPALAALAVAPLLLGYDALRVPDLVESSKSDGLTGLANAAHFDRTARAIFERMRAAGRPCAIVMIDLDDFKSVNDHLGHAGGDAALQRLAGLLRANISDGDQAARVGGDEFALLLPGTRTVEATRIAETIRREFYDQSAAGFAVTISAGIATSPAHGEALDVVRAAADAALYRSKANGRNRVTASG